MKKAIMAGFVVFASLTGQASNGGGRFSDESNASMIENMKARSCDTILSILLDTHAEAYRLSNAAIMRLEVNEKDKHGVALSQLAEGAYKRSDLLKELLKQKCMKE